MGNKVCIVLPCNIYVTPYYFRYEQKLEEMNINFDLIIWNRSGIKEESKGRIISYDILDNTNDGNKFKIYKFFKFAYFAKQILKENKYEKVFILGSYAGTAVLLSNFLAKYYKNNYWFDIRDYTYEWFKPYYLAMCKVIKNSYKTAISSTGYEEFLPEHNYIYAHNLDKATIEKCKKIKSIRRKDGIIRISFIGNIRYYEENIKLLNIFKNDIRFLLQYYGSNSEKLRSYCQENNITNVDFHGRFTPDKTAEFYGNTDIINNVYGSTGIELITAISNKLYFASSLEMPILVSKSTMMQKIACGYNFGYVIDYEDNNLANSLYEWYLNIDEKNMKLGCNEFMEKVHQDEKLFNYWLTKFLLKA